MCKMDCSVCLVHSKVFRLVQKSVCQDLVLYKLDMHRIKTRNKVGDISCALLVNISVELAGFCLNKCSYIPFLPRILFRELRVNVKSTDRV